MSGEVATVRTTIGPARSNGRWPRDRGPRNQRSPGRALNEREHLARVKPAKAKAPSRHLAVWTRGLQKKSGSDLLSRAVSRGVPSALEGLTSVFGMRTGGTPPTLPPEKQDSSYEG